MPRQQPFTLLCQQMARPALSDRADLHLHTTCSDGTYSPADVVNLALRCGLAAIAITDHDTLDAIEPARQAAADSRLEIVPAVEITAEHEGRELHLLAYFVSPENGPLGAALEQLREHRRERFRAMVERLRQQGAALGDDLPREGSLGRRHLAELLVLRGRVGSVREAFQRYLRDGACAEVPKKRLPIEEAIACVKAARGVPCWAHPPENVTLAELARLRGLGLQAIETEYPGFREGRRKRLRTMAAELGLAVTGGSDCHGDSRTGRGVGGCTISSAELEALRKLSRV